MRAFWARFSRSRAAVVGLVFFAIVVLVALFGPHLYPGGPFQFVAKPFEPPGAGHLFGTDMLGRDVAAGIVYGARTSLMIGLTSTAAAILFGAIVGAIAGYYGTWVDEALMRWTEIFQTIPFFVFAILLVAVLAPSVKSVILAIAVVSWPPMSRLVRGEFLSMRSREFVEACIGMGMSDFRVIFVHILPNCISSVIVTGSLMVATAILTESALSFLGLSDPNLMSWGFMVGAGREFLQRAPWLCAIPGAAILLTVLAINLVGEGLNDALNPRLRRI
jgi:peptide/nickel transport system permease protein